MILNIDPVSSLQAATKQYVDNVIQIGTYKGNGATGTKKRSITFRKNPKFVFICQVVKPSISIFGMFYVSGSNYAIAPIEGSITQDRCIMNVSVNNGVFSWDVIHDEVGFNFKNRNYYYIGIL